MSRRDGLRSELAELDREGQSVAAAMADTDRQIAATEHTCAELRERIHDSVRQAIHDGERFNFSDVDEQVEQLLAQLSDRQQSLDGVIHDAERAAEAANTEWQSAFQQLAAEEEVLDQCDQSIDNAVAEREEVKELVVREREIGLLAKRLGQRLAEAVEDARLKRKVYEDDRFFRYLLARDVGRESRRGVAARFDRWLGEACHFIENRRQYQVLVDLPEHLANAKKEAEQQQIDLKLEVLKARDAVAKEFNRGALQTRADAAHRDEQDAFAIREKKNAAVEAARDELKGIDSGAHALHREIDGVIDDAVTDQRLATFVKATLSQQDDAWLEQLRRAARDLTRLRATRSGLDSRQRNMRMEADEVQRRLRRRERRGSDDLGGIATAVLTGVLLGQIGRSHGGGSGGGFLGGGGSGSGGGSDGGFGGGDFFSGDSF